MIYIPSLTETGELVMDTIFIVIYYYHPLEKEIVLNLNKLQSPPPDDLCQVWLKLAKSIRKANLS